MKIQLIPITNFNEESNTWTARYEVFPAMAEGETEAEAIKNLELLFTVMVEKEYGKIEVAEDNYSDLVLESVLFSESAKAMRLQWVSSIGFGEVTIYQGKDNEITIDDELMSHAFLKALFAKFVDNYATKR